MEIEIKELAHRVTDTCMRHKKIFGLGHEMGHTGEGGQACVIVFLTGGLFAF